MVQSTRKDITQATPSSSKVPVDMTLAYQQVGKEKALTTSVTIQVEPTEEEFRMESADDILARQVQIENARDAQKQPNLLKKLATTTTATNTLK